MFCTKISQKNAIEVEVGHSLLIKFLAMLYFTGCCLMPLIDSLVVVEENNILCAIEGSHITYHCQPGMVPSVTKMSICMEDGTWSPNPRDLMCTSIERNNSSHLPSSST